MKLYRGAGVVFVFAIAGLAWAQQPARPASPEDKITARAQANVKGYIEYMDPIVSLTEEQKAAATKEIVAFTREHAELHAKLADTLKPLFADMQAAIENKDVQAIQDSAIAYQKASAPITELEQGHPQRLENLLTPGQKAKLKDARWTEEIKNAARPTELTPSQIKAVKMTIKEDDEDEVDPLQEAIQNVMTQGQKASFIKKRVTFAAKFWSKRVHFTEEQMKKADALGDQLAKDTNFRLQDIQERVTTGLTALLTPEQKAIAEEKTLANMEVTEGDD